MEGKKAKTAYTAMCSNSSFNGSKSLVCMARDLEGRSEPNDGNQNSRQPKHPEQSLDGDRMK